MLPKLMEEFLTIKEAAARIGVSSDTLRRWDKSGKFSPIRHPINNYRVYTISQVESLISDLELNFAHTGVSSNTCSDLVPFFTTGRGKLYNMDAIEFLKTLSSNSVDMVFADPPYNIKKAEWDTFESQKQYVEWSYQWIREASRILKPTGSLYVCGFSEILADIKWVASPLFKGCKWLVWYYRNKANLGNDWGRSHESIIHLRKSKNHIFNIDDVRIPYNAHTLKYPRRPQAKTSQYGKGKEYVWSPNPHGAKPKDVFEIPTISNGSWERYAHPTQKPVELLRKLILASSLEGSVIVDPFGGTGTTYAVAEALNRLWIGNELSKDYCKIIKARLTDRDHLSRIKSGRDELESAVRRVKLKGEAVPKYP
jgi:site-specific DNA-methyltransferase (adenine-specific)